jgi:hypothetical protein
LGNPPALPNNRYPRSLYKSFLLHGVSATIPLIAGHCSITGARWFGRSSAAPTCRHMNSVSRRRPHRGSAGHGRSQNQQRAALHGDRWHLCGQCFCLSVSGGTAADAAANRHHVTP